MEPGSVHFDAMSRARPSGTAFRLRRCPLAHPRIALTRWPSWLTSTPSP